MIHRHRGFGPSQLESLVIVVLIGIVAAISLPFIIDRQTSRYIRAAVEASKPLRDHIGQSIANGQMPLSIQDVEEKYADNLVDGKLIAKLTTREDGMVEIQFGRDSWRVPRSTLVSTPIIEADGSIKWVCAGGSLERRYWPDECEQKEPSP